MKGFFSPPKLKAIRIDLNKVARPPARRIIQDIIRRPVKKAEPKKPEIHIPEIIQEIPEVIPEVVVHDVIPEPVAEVIPVPEITYTIPEPEYIPEPIVQIQEVQEITPEPEVIVTLPATISTRRGFWRTFGYFLKQLLHFAAWYDPKTGKRV